ncbi:hypothetical protein [Streptomyces sp. CB01635]|uniref:hypothetical protein n=1 Tax=unclassified Streptomyces TaxID=2593676 RepID=UPI001F3AAE0C|nr:hypothetical protein [Streptomyces sp. CB01635]
MSIATLPGDGWIRGVTIRQPFHLHPRREEPGKNRPRPWPWRGSVLIHAGQKLERLPCVTR